MEDLQQKINQLKAKIVQIKDQIKQIENPKGMQDDEEQNFFKILSQVMMQAWYTIITMVIGNKFKMETIALTDLIDLNCI